MFSIFRRCFHQLISKGYDDEYDFDYSHFEGGSLDEDDTISNSVNSA